MVQFLEKVQNKKCAGCHWGRPAPNFHFMVMWPDSLVTRCTYHILLIGCTTVRYVITPWRSDLESNFGRFLETSNQALSPIWPQIWAYLLPSCPNLGFKKWRFCQNLSIFLSFWSIFLVSPSFSCSLLNAVRLLNVGCSLHVQWRNARVR